MAKNTTNNTGIAYNTITRGSKITGDIHVENDFRLDGDVEGEIFSNGKVVIYGSLKGTLSCVTAEIFGTVVGNINVEDALSLRSTANVLGDIKTRILSVEPNAILNATCSIKGSDIDSLEKKSE